jgi:hypothetical protein
VLPEVVLPEVVLPEVVLLELMLLELMLLELMLLQVGRRVGQRERGSTGGGSSTLALPPGSAQPPINTEEAWCGNNGGRNR